MIRPPWTEESMMVSETRSSPVDSPEPGVIPDGAGEGVGGAVAEPELAPAGAEPTTATDRETRRARARRKAHRSRLHSYAILTVALVAFLIALGASNTARVKVSWVFGTSRVSLVWLVLFGAIVGWLLGLISTAAFQWRTRAPRRRAGSA